MNKIHVLSNLFIALIDLIGFVVMLCCALIIVVFICLSAFSVMRYLWVGIL